MALEIMQPKLNTDDLSSYFSQQDKIKILQDEIRLLKTKLNTERKAKSRYKAKLDAITGDKRLSRGEKALNLIKEIKGSDKPGRIINRVAKECHLTVNYVSILFYKGVIQ